MSTATRLVEALLQGVIQSRRKSASITAKWIQINSKIFRHFCQIWMYQSLKFVSPYFPFIQSALVEYRCFYYTSSTSCLDTGEGFEWKPGKLINDLLTLLKRSHLFTKAPLKWMEDQKIAFLDDLSHRHAQHLCEVMHSINIEEKTFRIEPGS